MSKSGSPIHCSGRVGILGGKLLILQTVLSQRRNFLERRLGEVRLSPGPEGLPQEGP
jgi:hypothetical protein